jgi:dTDP-4-dehydrorhamnose reductase
MVGEGLGLFERFESRGKQEVRILVTGASGMLGTALVPVLQQRHQVWGMDVNDCDIRDSETVSAVIRARQPELVIHLAAYTDVDGCEANPQIAEATNSTGTRNVATACAEVDAAMFYVSTDYVFDGTKRGPYLEDDLPNPISAYGRSKWLGEQHVRAILKRYFIARTSWLYGPHGKNFVSTILRVAHQQEVLRVVNDQHGSPTYTRHFSLKIAELAATQAYGVYHTTGSGTCSWFGFARTILELWPVEGVQLLPISSEESGRVARRPANSVLENRALKQAHLELMPHWKVALAEYLDEIKQSGQRRDFEGSKRGTAN